MSSHNKKKYIMATTLLKNARILLLGGGGLVGSTIAKHLCRLPRQVRPGQIILAALTQQEAERASEEVQQGLSSPSTGSNINIIPVWGDMFVRRELALETDILVGQKQQQLSDKDLVRLRHGMMLEDLYGNFDAAYERSRLVETFREYRPHIVVDCINTATVIAYKNNIFEATSKLQESLGGLQNVMTSTINLSGDAAGTIDAAVDSVLEDSEITMLAQPTPSLIRHIQILAKVSEEVGLRQYIKIGTTGTGGMGMNIPYTHSENKTCPTLLAKTFTAFGHSGLLMLWSCTPGAPVVKEIKPAAAIGYRGIDVREVKDRFGNSKIRQVRAIKLGETDTLDLREEKVKTNNDEKANDNLQHSASVTRIDASYPEICPLIMKVLDLGENGFFTRDEFMTITAPDQMEMITPKEISEQVVEELLGVSTGKNVLSAMKGSLLGPGYRAGIERMKADLRLRNDVDIGATAASIALGKLGPPQLSKLLFEANILKDKYGTYRNLIDANAEEAAQLFVTMAEKLQQQQQQPGETTTNMSSIQSSLHVAPSVGVPILLQGNILLRGANISVPDVPGHSSIIQCPKGVVLDKIAGYGWIDLRRESIERWQERARRILQSHDDDKEYSSGTVINIEDEAIVAFDMAAWVLGRELEGHRDFYLA